MTQRKARFRQAGWLVLLVLLAVCVGTTLQPRPAAEAGVRETTPKEHFLAGSERSLPVLQEISTTLKQIDSRLAKIETPIAVAADRQGNR